MTKNIPVVETSLRIVSLYATCSGPRWVSRPYSLLIRSWMISMWSSPIPHKMVWRTESEKHFSWLIVADGLTTRVYLIQWWQYLARIGVHSDFKTGVLSLEAAECILKIFQDKKNGVTTSSCMQQSYNLCDWPACLAIVGASMVQKKTGSGTSTPERTMFPCSPRFFLAPPSLWARRAAAAAEAFEETMVSPVTVLG